MKKWLCNFTVDKPTEVKKTEKGKDENGNEVDITRTLNKFLRYADGEDAGVITKTYLYNKCRSRFLEIPPEEWELACALPMENFRKEHKTKAWFDTREKLQ